MLDILYWTNKNKISDIHTNKQKLEYKLYADEEHQSYSFIILERNEDLIILRISHRKDNAQFYCKSVIPHLWL